MLLYMSEDATFFSLPRDKSNIMTFFYNPSNPPIFVEFLKFQLKNKTKLKFFVKNCTLSRHAHFKQP